MEKGIFQQIQPHGKHGLEEGDVISNLHQFTGHSERFGLQWRSWEEQDWRFADKEDWELCKSVSWKEPNG